MLFITVITSTKKQRFVYHNKNKHI